MRGLWVFLLLLPTFGFCQGAGNGVWSTLFRYSMDSADIASGKSVFQVSRPDIIIQIYKHRVGADMFQITAVSPDYPPELLKSQINHMCDILGVPARGLLVANMNLNDDPKLRSTRATFATNGVIDREAGMFKITPILQAFVGAPEPYTVHGLMISFNGEQATPNVLRSFASPGIRLQAIANQNPSAVEYRIQYLTQDPKMAVVPDTTSSEQKPLQTASTVQRNGTDWSLWLPLLAAAVAAGLLVYFLMIRISAKPRL